jgi:hypothetical protein
MPGRDCKADGPHPLEQEFAAVFHSFGDLRKVNPATFLAELRKAGIVLQRENPDAEA